MPLTDKTKVTKHESFGMCGVSRFEGGSSTYFGSSIKHHGGIAITIRHAHLQRDLNRDWISPDDEIIEINMSYNQYADMISSPNTGSGVPCTIRHINRKRIENPPYESKAEEHRQEFQATMENIAKDGTLYMKEALDILKNKTTISKADRNTIIDAFKMFKQEIESNMPFAFTQFQEQMDKTVTEAKAEIEGFIETKIRSAGLESIRGNLPALMESDSTLIETKQIGGLKISTPRYFEDDEVCGWCNRQPGEQHKSGCRQ